MKIELRSELDHKYTEEYVCPHCGYEHQDSWEWPEEGEETCDSCGKDFEFHRDVTVTYCTTKKAETNNS